jgi:hypothetical protein
VEGGAAVAVRVGADWPDPHLDSENIPQTAMNIAASPADDELCGEGARTLKQVPDGREKDLGRKRLLEERNG